MSDNFPAITIGDDVVVTIAFTNPDTEAVVDITGYTIVMDVWNALGTFQKSTGAGITLTNPTAGIAQVAIDAADWEPWADVTENQTFNFEIQRTNGAGKINTPTPVKGKFTAAWQRIK